MKNAFKAMRPHHWVKNLLVLAPVFFSGNLLNVKALLIELAAFAVFSLISSHVYLINDIIDVETDRSDPEKRNRPIASGSLSVRSALIMSALFGASAAGLSFLFGTAFFCCLLAYVVLTHAYSLFLKKFYIPGIAAIAAGMLIRILAGAVAIKVEISPWVYPSAFILTFYVVAGKRMFDSGNQPSIEKNIFLFSGILTTAVYAGYAFSGVGPEKYDTEYLWTTIPLVAAACARYFFVIINHKGNREHLISTLSDAPLIGVVFAWALVFGFLIYL